VNSPAIKPPATSDAAEVGRSRRRRGNNHLLPPHGRLTMAVLAERGLSLAAPRHFHRASGVRLGFLLRN
jgi:hypothetical protein